MSCTQLVIVPKAEPESTMSLHSPYETPETLRQQHAQSLALSLTELAKLVYGKQ